MYLKPFCQSHDHLLLDVFIRPFLLNVNDMISCCEIDLWLRPFIFIVNLNMNEMNNKSTQSFEFILSGEVIIMIMNFI